MNSAAQVELWKAIPETHGDYEVSNTGKVRNCITGTIRKPYHLPNGYLVVCYHINKRNCKRYIHRLVAEAFCNHTEGCNVVNHIDNNKRNNRADNLEWTTQFGNVHHGMKQKRYYKNAVAVVGFKDGKRYEFVSANDAYKKTGCDNSGIIKCCKGMQRQSKGYIWRYAEVV